MSKKKLRLARRFFSRHPFYRAHWEWGAGCQRRWAQRLDPGRL